MHIAVQRGHFGPEATAHVEMSRRPTMSRLRAFRRKDPPPSHSRPRIAKRKMKCLLRNPSFPARRRRRVALRHQHFDLTKRPRGLRCARTFSSVCSKLIVPASSGMTYSVVPISSNAERTRYLAEGRFFGVAHLNAAAEQAAALGGGFGRALTDLAQPTLEGGCVGRGLFSQQSRDLAQ